MGSRNISRERETAVHRKLSKTEISRKSARVEAAGDREHPPEEAIHFNRFTPVNVLQLQRAIGNRAASQFLSGVERDSPATIQRFTTSRLHPGMKISDNGKMALEGSRKLYVRPHVLKAAAEALETNGALVTLKSSSDKTTYSINSVDYVLVELAINPTAVRGRLWERLRKKQPQKGYYSFADCFRTSATVSGINPGAPGQKEELRLPTETIPMMTKLESIENKVPDTPAARATATFFSHAFPKFLTQLKGLADLSPAYAPLIAELERYSRLLGEAKTQGGPRVYKAILATAGAKKLFTSTFGINEDIVPAIGVALTQVNDPTEKEEAGERGEDKWNFHWAGIILVDGGDYITLENCAIELEEATVAEMGWNADILNEADTPKGRTVKSQTFTKQDIINDRWYFKMYSRGEKSFHSENLADSHATPSAITLPVSKA